MTYLRKVAIADFEGITANTTYVLEPKDPNVLLPDMLPFIMQTESFNQHSVRESKGSVNPYVNFSDLAWFEFALPPIEEQRRMVDVLVAAESASQAARELESATMLCHKSFCQLLFKLSPGQRPPGQETLGEGWVLRPLVDVAEFLDGRRVPLKSSDRAKRQGPYPYYGASGIIDHIDDYLFDEPLVLLSEDGANLVDRSTPIAFEATGRYWVNNHAHVFRVRQPLFNRVVSVKWWKSLSASSSGT